MESLVTSPWSPLGATQGQEALCSAEISNSLLIVALLHTPRCDPESGRHICSLRTWLASTRKP